MAKKFGWAIGEHVWMNIWRWHRHQCFILYQNGSKFSLLFLEVVILFFILQKKIEKEVKALLQPPQVFWSPDARPVRIIPIHAFKLGICSPGERKSECDAFVAGILAGFPQKVGYEFGGKGLGVALTGGTGRNAQVLRVGDAIDGINAFILGSIPPPSSLAPAKNPPKLKSLKWLSCSATKRLDSACIVRMELQRENFDKGWEVAKRPLAGTPISFVLERNGGGFKPQVAFFLNFFNDLLHQSNFLYFLHFL
jgi:hypothetical protein